MEIDRDIIYKRTLRVSTVIAHRNYDCDNCHHPIQAGEEHGVEVITCHVRFRATGRVQKMISTWRRHTDGCDPDDEEDEDDRIQKEETVEHALPLAA